MANDPYRVLGLGPGASGADIKRAYRALAKANHPDSAGEASLPRFLAIQAAYEQLVPVANRGPGRSRATSSPAEPWRADPGRARQTRGARPRGSSAESESPDGSASQRPRGGPSGAGPRSRTADGPAAGTRARSGSPGGSAGDPGTGGRRRATKKATFGSTTYDGDRETADPTWQGAAWYGPSSGEYWTVNPREYADPRKHGPEYQARAADRAARARAAEATERRSGAARERGPTTGAAPRRGATDGAARDRTPEPGVRDSARTEALHQARAQARRAAAARERSARSGPEAVATHDAEDPESGDGSLAASLLGLLPDVDWGRLGRSPYRRFYAAFAAWPPIGIVLAAAIGEATGCAVFAATCTREATFLPWVAQAIVIAVLLALPGLARALVGGTIGVAVLAFPAVAVLSAGGATYDTTYGPAALATLLGIGWLVGALLMTARIVSRRSVA